MMKELSKYVCSMEFKIRTCESWSSIWQDRFECCRNCLWKCLGTPQWRRQLQKNRENPWISVFPCHGSSKGYALLTVDLALSFARSIFIALICSWHHLKPGILNGSGHIIESETSLLLVVYSSWGVAVTISLKRSLLVFHLIRSVFVYSSVVDIICKDWESYCSEGRCCNTIWSLEFHLQWRKTTLLE